MKKRRFFVANSSSSSFAVIGELVRLADVKLEEDVFYYAIGDAEMEEGEDVFEIDETLLWFMRMSLGDFTIVRAMWIGWDGGSKVDVDLSGATYVWAGRASQHHSDKDYFWTMYQVDGEMAKAAFKRSELTLDELMEMLGK